MASARGLALVHAERSYICLNCQLRAIPSASSRRNRSSLGATSAARIANSPIQSRHYATDNEPPRRTSRRESWTDRLRKNLWENGEGPDPRSFVVPGESIEEREERIKGDEDEKAAKQREESDFEELRKAGFNARLEHASAGSKALEVRGGFSMVSDEEKVIKSESSQPQVQAVEYKPATRWRGLRHITHWDEAQKEPKPLFTGYLAREKADDPASIERAVQRALIEVWVLKQAGVSMASSTARGHPTPDFEDRLAASAIFEEAIDRVDYNLRFTDSALLGEVEESFRSDAGAEAETQNAHRVNQDMIKGYEEEGKRPPQPASTIESITHKHQQDTESNLSGDVQQTSQDLDRPHQSYRAVSLVDSNIKFEVIKRAMQLTGKRIADPVINDLQTAGDLVRHLTTPPPTARLSEDLVAKDIVNLSNVEIRSKRYTQKDREMEIGRWKLIEAELVKRGLPLDRLARTDGGKVGPVKLKHLRFSSMRDSQETSDSANR